MPTVIAAGASFVGVAEESHSDSKQGGTAKKFALGTMCSEGFFVPYTEKNKMYHKKENQNYGNL